MKRLRNTDKFWPLRVPLVFTCGYNCYTEPDGKASVDNFEPLIRSDFILKIKILQGETVSLKVQELLKLVYKNLYYYSRYIICFITVYF
jgi:hypothetical protein